MAWYSKAGHFRNSITLAPILGDNLVNPTPAIPAPLGISASFSGFQRPQKVFMALRDVAVCHTYAMQQHVRRSFLDLPPRMV